MVREILKLGDPRLYKISEEVTKEDSEKVSEWVLDLQDTLMHHLKT